MLKKKYTVKLRAKEEGKCNWEILSKLGFLVATLVMSLL